MSAGGVIGGIAAGLIAPYVFNWVAEYPILIALAVLCRPGLALPSDAAGATRCSADWRPRQLLLVISTFVPVTLDETTFNWTVGALLAACVLSWRTPLPFAAIVAFVLLANHNVVEQAGAMSVRSFFGVAKISETGNGQFRILQHGTTLHGGQRIRAAEWTAGARPAGALDVLLGRLRHCPGVRCGACPHRRPDPLRRDRARRRLPRLPRGAGRHRALLRDRSRHHPHRPRPESVHLPVGLPAGCADHARRCAAHAGGGARRRLRPHRGRRLLLRRHSHPPGHARGDGDLPEEAQPPRDGGDARVEPPPRARLGGRRHRRRERPDHAASTTARISTRRPIRTSFPAPSPRLPAARRTSARSRRRADWEIQEPDPRQWVWTDDYSNIVGSVLRKLNE